MKMLQTPISQWKYIGVLDWQPSHAHNLDFQLAELELVIATALDMYIFYQRIEAKILASGDVDADENGKKTANGLQRIKISGKRLE